MASGGALARRGTVLRGLHGSSRVVSSQFFRGHVLPQVHSARLSTNFLLALVQMCIPLGLLHTAASYLYPSPPSHPSWWLWPSLCRVHTLQSGENWILGKEHKGGHNPENTKEYMLLNASAVNAVQDVMKFNHNSQRLEKWVEKTNSQQSCVRAAGTAVQRGFVCSNFF